MQFTKVLLAAAAFAVANAQVKFTMGPSFFAVTYTAGVTPMNLTWDMNSGPVTLKLKNGPQNALNTVSTIATGVAGNSYPYTPPSTLANGQYAFEIDDSSSGVINYSAFFTLTGGSGVASNSTMTSASTSGSSSSASSSPTTSASTTKTTSSVTKSTATNSPTASTTTPNTNSAFSISSPLALVLLAFAAMVTLN